MKRTAIQMRLARLQQECDVSAAPALLLLATCSALALASGMHALLEEAATEQPGQLTLHHPAPAALHEDRRRGVGLNARLPVRRQATVETAPAGTVADSRCRAALAAGARCPVARDAAV